MLILEVFEDGAVVIGGNVVVRLIEMRGGNRRSVKLGITAEKGVTVNREEVEDAKNPGWRQHVRERIGG